VLHAHKVVARQINNVACVKTIKFSAKNKVFYMTIFVFLYRPQNVSVKRAYEYVNAKKLEFFLNISKYFFIEEAYALGSRIKFSLRTEVL
jgi:hypothetical protein